MQPNPSFNPYSAGQKHYGAGNSMAATMGTPDKAGYAERDQKLAARRNAILKRIQAGQSGSVIGQPPMNTGGGFI